MKKSNSKEINLGTFKWDAENPDILREKMDNDLKIALLNFLTSSDISFNIIIPQQHRKKDSSIFEQCFYYIKNLKLD